MRHLVCIFVLQVVGANREELLHLEHVARARICTALHTGDSGPPIRCVLSTTCEGTEQAVASTVILQYCAKSPLSAESRSRVLFTFSCARCATCNRLVAASMDFRRLRRLGCEGGSVRGSDSVAKWFGGRHLVAEVN